MSAQSSFTRELTLLNSVATPPDFFKESLNAFQHRTTILTSNTFRSANISTRRLNALDSNILYYNAVCADLVAKGYVGPNAPSAVPIINKDDASVTRPDQFYNEKDTAYNIKWKKQNYITAIEIMVGSTRVDPSPSKSAVEYSTRQPYGDQKYDPKNIFVISLFFVNPIGRSLPYKMEVPFAYKPPIIETNRAANPIYIYIKLKDFNKDLQYKYIAVYSVLNNTQDITDKRYIGSIEYNSFKIKTDEYDDIGSATSPGTFQTPIQGIYIVGVFSNVPHGQYDPKDATQRSPVVPVPNLPSNPIIW
jgi:hypothetical protein